MIEVASIFQDNMILQREKKIAFWGKGDSGKEIVIKIQDKIGRGIVDEDGTWKIFIDALRASEKEQLIIYGSQEKKVFENVAVGEVWVAAGQSNMEFQLFYEKDWIREKENVNWNLRFYDVPKVCFDGQKELFDYSRFGKWQSVRKEYLAYFSAVGYYFQKKIHDEEKVPVGIIGCNWGGTSTSVWMKKSSVLRQWLDKFQADSSEMDMDEYWNTIRTNPISDKGNPFANPIWNEMMRRTPTGEEIYLMSMQQYGKVEEPCQLMEPQTVPGCLYDHMLKTIVPYGVRGILWYQGESDDQDGLGKLHFDMLSRVIRDWREAFMDHELPFFIVQLPGFEQWLMIRNQEYSVIRECQERVAKEISHTYLCSISDAGEEFDIHPKNKRIVGERLSLLAEKHVYGREVLCDPPKVRAAVYNEKRIIISFDNVGQQLKLKGKHINALELYGESDEVIRYSFEINKNQILLYPEYTVNKIRFAKDNWYKVNLYNENDIPAIPFQLILQ